MGRFRALKNDAVTSLAETDAEFVFGSAPPHPDDLALSYHAVHLERRRWVNSASKLDRALGPGGR